jgi:hypothetical protein
LDSIQTIYDTEPYVFGIVSSKIHMVWVRAVGGKLKTDFYKEAQKEYNKERQYTKQDILNLLNDKVIDEKNKKYRNWK